MRLYIGFDDTDTIDSPVGTGKLARRFEAQLPEGYRLWGVVRQQLLVAPSIPYTSHNSAACLVVEVPEPVNPDPVIALAVRHLETHACDGSDPGVCVAMEGWTDMSALVDFGMACTRRPVTQKEAVQAVNGYHLSGHGGTNDGIIGAAAAVGLTVSGWSGRFIEYGRLRELPERMSVSDLTRLGIEVISVDRDARVPAPDDTVITHHWVRPRLFGGRPVLMVSPAGDGVWENTGRKRRKKGTAQGGHPLG